MEQGLVSAILFGLFFGIPILWPFLIRTYQNRQYKKSAYYQITKNSYSSIKRNSGRYGEYLIYKNLQHFEQSSGKFLFNVYIPKSDNETSEIDVLLICSKGLFVFESKNFSGWIFGNESHKNWTQTLPRGWNGDCLKVRFYNPILQNASHISSLRRLFDERVPMHSIIVFSDRCALKGITLRSDNVSVINRNNLSSAVDKIWNESPTNLLTQAEINDIYSKLYPYTQSNDEVKEQHEKNVRRYLESSDPKTSIFVH